MTLNTISKKFFNIGFLFGISMVFLSQISWASSSQPKSPHILFIVVDDLRPQLGCYGQKQMITPNIDRIAAEGVVFTRAYCQVPVCGASRASLLTGIRPNRERFLTYSSWAQDDAPGATDLPLQLKKYGYKTISNGKVYHHSKDNEASWDEIYRPSGFRQYQTKPNISLMNELKKAAAYESPEVEDYVLQGGKIADKVIQDLLKAKKSGQPTFITAGFTKPHLPFIAPKKYWNMYDRYEIKLVNNPFAPQNCPKEALHNWAELRNQYTGIPETGPLSDSLARTLIHGYYACVTYTGEMIGKILRQLDLLDMHKNTIIVLWGDHGWQLGEHGLWCKHCNFNTSLQAPLIVSAPGMNQGVKCDALVEFVDIYPSLCQLVGSPLPDRLQGISFVSLLRNPKKEWKQAVYSRFRNGESVRTDRYLYTEWRKDGKLVARMLYDHEKDPHENINIVDRPENRKIVDELNQLLKSHYQSIK